MQNNLYKNSWELYKAESENFTEDFNYYKDICRNKRVLELFSGYGRLANHLKWHAKSITCVELERNFTQHINLPKENINICNVLDYKTDNLYEIIIAGYNSFTLLTNDNDIRIFFKNMSSWLTHDGLISLSYYNYKTWKETEIKEIFLQNNVYSYQSQLIPHQKYSGLATWKDLYTNKFDNTTIEFNYPIKIYADHAELEEYARAGGLELINIVNNYGNKDKKEHEWFEYVFKKTQ